MPFKVRAGLYFRACEGNAPPQPKSSRVPNRACVHGRCARPISRCARTGFERASARLSAFFPRHANIAAGLCSPRRRFDGSFVPRAAGAGRLCLRFARKAYRSGAIISRFFDVRESGRAVALKINGRIELPTSVTVFSRRRAAEKEKSGGKS